MKIIFGTVGFLILLLVLSFALSNPASVTIGLWPFTDKTAMPLYIVGLVPLVFGILFGGMWGWIGSVPHRLRARRLNKEIHELNHKIGDLQRTAIINHPEPEPVKKSFFWKRP